MQHAAKATIKAGAFNPSDAGTAEEKWLTHLHAKPAWVPEKGPLIVVSPHPDDEVLAAGGLIHSWAASGHPVAIVSVTDGEAAFPRWPGLDLVRRDELKGALRKLCLTHVTVVRVGLPDGEVARHENRLRNALLALVEPGVTVIAPYEHDGHCDHEAIGGVCVGLARTHGIALASYPVWTWHHAAPASFRDARWGKFMLSFEARRAKARAVQCFESQLKPPNRPPVVPHHVLPYFQRPYEAFLL